MSKAVIYKNVYVEGFLSNHLIFIRWFLTNFPMFYYLLHNLLFIQKKDYPLLVIYFLILLSVLSTCLGHLRLQAHIRIVVCLSYQSSSAPTQKKDNIKVLLQI